MSVENPLAALELDADPVSTTVKLPMPPSANSMYRNIYGHGRVRTAPYQRWCEAAGWLIRASHARPFSERVRIEIRVGKSGRRRDLDNLAKPIIDALVTNCIIPDDSDKHVREITLRWDPTIDAEHVAVTVRAM